MWSYKVGGRLAESDFMRQISSQTVGLYCSCMVWFSVCVLAESQEIKQLLSEQDIVAQTVAEALPIRVMSARILSRIYVRLGKHTSSFVVTSVCV